MDSIWIGILSGFVATSVLSAFMAMKQVAGLMRQMDMIGMISGMLKSSRTIGWLVHFAVGGILYGGVFGWIFAPAAGTNGYWLMGALLGVLGWLIAMSVMMPMSGNGFFGLKLGGMVPVMSLMMHLVFGVVLGWTYGVVIS